MLEKQQRNKTFFMFRLDVKDDVNVNSKASFKRCINHKRHMLVANLNDNNDSSIGKFAGNRFEHV